MKRFPAPGDRPSKRASGGARAAQRRHEDGFESGCRHPHGGDDDGFHFCTTAVAAAVALVRLNSAPAKANRLAAMPAVLAMLSLLLRLNSVFIYFFLGRWCVLLR